MDKENQNSITTLIKNFDAFSKDVIRRLDEVRRALYGDEKNAVLGLLERQKNDEVRLASLDKDLSKANEEIKILKAQVVKFEKEITDAKSEIKKQGDLINRYKWIGLGIVATLELLFRLLGNPFKKE